MLTFLTVVVAAIIFEYSNGFHDAANAIATVVSTKVLTPRQAIAMAAFFNLTGALLGGAVASTIGKGLVDTNVVTMSPRLRGTSPRGGSVCLRARVTLLSVDYAAPRLQRRAAIGRS